MRFLLDNDVPAEIERLLVGRGHEVATVRGSMSETAHDDEVFNAAQTGNKILVTCNRGDFLALAKEREHAGLIILIRRRTRISEGAALLRLIERAGTRGLMGNINFA